MSRVCGNMEDNVCSLLVDEYIVHKSDNIQADASERNMDLVFMSGGCTSLVQPLGI